MKVLIADQHEVVRLGLTQWLKSHTIIEATDAGEAIKLYKKQKPDVTLLETRLPGDGLDCLARIKRHDPAAKVLMFSGYDNPTYLARAVAIGASGYLSKSATGKELLSAVKTVAAGGDIWEARRATGELIMSDGVNLTRRESDVLRQLALGLTNKEIGMALGISYETVKEHVQHILRKLGVTDRTQAAVWVVRRELV